MPECHIDTYRLLMPQKGIRTAQRDITLASLYIGTEGAPDTAVIEALACAAAKHADEAPKITILLDALRSTRPSKDPSGAVCPLRLCRELQILYEFMCSQTLWCPAPPSPTTS